MSLAWQSPIPESQPNASALLNDRQVAEMTAVSISTLRFLWLTGHGPAYTEHQGRVRCTLADVQRWQRSRSLAHQRLIDSYGRV